MKFFTGVMLFICMIVAVVVGNLLFHIGAAFMLQRVPNLPQPPAEEPTV